MQKKYLLFFLLFSIYCTAQNFDSFASGIRINNTIYNVTGTDPIHQVNSGPGAAFFSGTHLGNFAANSPCASISAAEVKTWKNITGNVCSVKLHWRVYEQLGVPGAFNTLALTEVNDCNTTTGAFNDGFGPCAANDQKWKDYALNSNFISGLPAGMYNLEIYYSITGSDVNNFDCEATHYISNFGTNFTASFTINNVVTTASSSGSACEGGNLILNATATGGNAPYTYSWTGPNGFTSTAQNPTILPATMTNAGTYFVVATDACGIPSASSSVAVTITPGTIPTFDAILPAICRGGQPPLLVNQSTNGITGTWSPATVSNTATATYVFTPDPGQCAVPASQTIFVVNNVTPAFTLPLTLCYGTTPPTLPALSANGVFGSWNPPTVNNEETATYTFTPAAGQCAVVAIHTITVNIVTPAFNSIPPICEGGMAPILPATSLNGIFGSWSPLIVSNTATATYTFTPNAGQCARPISLTVTVVPNLTPTFDPIPPFCQGTAAPVLPGTSSNGVVGTWNPSTVSNTTSGTYTFTPALCGPSATLNISVTPNIIPSFDPILPLCMGQTAPGLPAVSNNGIGGTWNPAIIDNTASGTYTFTPLPNDDCIIPVSISVTVNPVVAALFPAIPTICAGGAVPVLPTISDNGISGTWDPSVIDNMASADYLFTPDNGECSTPLTISVTIGPNITPLFPAIPPICAGAAAPILPLVSTNGITGTWSPALIDNLLTGTYTFTPDAGLCAAEISTSVTVEPVITPAFSFETVLCAGSTAPTLPVVSDNGVAGTWSPALISNLLTNTYTFTPSVGECALPLAVTVIVEPVVVPTFSAIPPICAGAPAPLLPSTSIEGIPGTWTPSVVSNTATATYNFTPDTGLCAAQSSVTIVVDQVIIPQFTAIPPICEGSPVPTLSNVSINGITGSWSPSTINNSTTDSYSFTPDAGQCAAELNITVTVNPRVAPIFSFATTLCIGELAPVLPTISDNNVSGSWSPLSIDNLLSASYTFTPDSGECADPVTVQVTVLPLQLPQFASVPPLCEGSTAPTLPVMSTNGITGSWLPSTISNASSGTYIFTPAEGQCALPASVTVTVLPNQIPVFDAIPPICVMSPPPVLPLISNNLIAGTWNPATVDNQNTATYTFTPTGGTCLLPVTMTIEVVPNITPAFSFPVQFCSGESTPTLPAVSDNGITGTWSPAVVDDLAAGNYTFTPTSGPCSLSTTVSIDIIPNITPSFVIPTSICEGSGAPSLPSISTNGISGSWSPPTVSNTASGTYTFTPGSGQCALSISVTITIIPNATPIFNPIPAICATDPAPILPNLSVNGIIGTWNPALVDNTSTLVYTFTPDGPVCALPVSITIVVEPNVLPSFSFPTQYCAGATVPNLPAISDNGISGTWSPALIDNNFSAAYTFTPTAGLCAVPIARAVMITPPLTPQFDTIAPICEGSVPPVLPTVSNNGISGTWSPAVISNTTSDIYTFTASPEVCATTTSLSITVVPIPVPTFDVIASICAGDIAPVLPFTSSNGINGSWTPAIVSNANSGTYTFTPEAASCALPITISVTVNPIISPEFNLNTQLCAAVVPPVLPTVSTNGITGTWSPAVVDNTSSGTYTFTPVAGVCAVPYTLNITVDPIVIPQFAALPPTCSIALGTVLPATSLNGITGTWSPEQINMASSATYTFTPAPGQCAIVITLDVTIVAPVTPQFTIAQSICEGGAAPILPLMSDNGVPGTWSPAVVSNTETGIYVFNPSPLVCALPYTLTVNVVPMVTPTFILPVSICAGDAPISLPLVSDNGITGTWNPSLLNTSTTTVYTFTPDSGICATTLETTIVVNPVITPAFDPISPICENSVSPVLALTSTNGVSGSWTPASVDNTTTATYTFTPDNGQCAVPATITVTVTPISIPQFAALLPICAGEAAPLLPAVSLNGINGTWNPSIVNNNISDIYTFTPEAGICAPAVTLSMTVNPVVLPQFSPIADICIGNPVPALQAISNEGITGSWNPPLISNTTSATYTFTPDAGQCAIPAAIFVAVTPIQIPTFNFSTTICEDSIQPALPLTSVNGISGTWSPAIIDNTTTGIYNFTPDANQCASATAVTISVTPLVVPTFDTIAAICSGTTAPSLPLLSNNGITGTWSPAVVSNTTSATYTFTPNGIQCGVAIAVDITVNNSPDDMEFITTNVMNGAAAGVITVEYVNNGTGPFEYSIDGDSFVSDNVFTNLLPGEYTITVRDVNGCEFSSTTEITSACKFPKGLSPNNDGDNDVLIVNGCSVSSLEIFNRYGTSVKSYRIYNNDWDGTASNGEQLPVGTYFYVAQTTDGEKSGWIYLQR